MTNQEQQRQNPLGECRRTAFSYCDMHHEVYLFGRGPPIILLHELPGLGDRAVELAHHLANVGFEVHLPHLFGVVGGRQPYKNYRALCVSREFANLAAGVSAPITCWLRAYAVDISAQGNSRVGAIGMCVTGSFAIPLVLESCVVAPVTCQPAIPLSLLYRITGLGGTQWAYELNVSSQAVREAAKRLSAENITLLAFRFEEDRLCPRARFDRLRIEFGAQLEAHEYPASSCLRAYFAPRHSVLTGNYGARRPEDGNNPHKLAMERLCAFLQDNLIK
jgi:dienelactone hydrolase